MVIRTLLEVININLNFIPTEIALANVDLDGMMEVELMQNLTNPTQNLTNGSKDLPS
jgi:hypothetical protein